MNKEELEDIMLDFLLDNFEDELKRDDAGSILRQLYDMEKKDGVICRYLRNAGCPDNIVHTCCEYEAVLAFSFLLLKYLPEHSDILTLVSLLHPGAESATAWISNLFLTLYDSVNSEHVVFDIPATVSPKRLTIFTNYDVKSLKTVECKFDDSLKSLEGWSMYYEPAQYRSWQYVISLPDSLEGVFDVTEFLDTNINNIPTLNMITFLYKPTASGKPAFSLPPEIEKQCWKCFKPKP